MEKCFIQVLKISDELGNHYQNDIDDKIIKLEKDWELEFMKQKHEFDERVTALQKEQWTQCQEAIERVTLDAEDQLKNMKLAHDGETAEFKRQIQELLEKQTLSEMKEKELDKEKCRKENESFEKIKILEEQLSDERDEVEAQINVAQNEIKTLKEEHERQMKSLDTELQKKYSDVLCECKNEMKSKYQAELDEKVHRVESYLRQQYEQDLEKTREELHESSTTLKTKYENQLAEVFSQLEELHERNQEHELREAKLKKDYESAKKTLKELRLEVKKQSDRNNLQEGIEDDHYKDSHSQFKESKEKLQKVFDEKKSLEERVHDLSSQLLSFKEKVDESEKEKEELKSQNEKEVLKIKSSYEEEISKLKTDLEQWETNVTKLQETRSRELEITNLIQHSPKPTETDEIEREFKCGYSPGERIKQLEMKITEYKKKVMELEEEAQDKFETTLCHKCQEGKTPELNAVKAKDLVEKIEKECKEKVESLNKNLEVTEGKLNEQKKISEDLAEELKKRDTELENESKRSAELLKFNKHADINHIALLTEKTEEQMSDVKPERETSKDPTGPNEENNDKIVGKEKVQKITFVGQTEILKVKEEYNKLLEEKQKDFKVEFDLKDSEISKLLSKNEEMQRFHETLRQKQTRDEQKYKELTMRAMDQKRNYESEIQLMQNEIKVLIQENKDHESQHKVLEGYQEENVKLQMKIEEMEGIMAKSAADHQDEIGRLDEMLQAKEHCLQDLKRMNQSLEISTKNIDANIENLKKQFEEKEKELLNEIREKAAMFEREKDEILENSFQEKRELQTRIDDLERQCENSDIWLKREEEYVISKSNSNEKGYPNEPEESLTSDHDNSVPFKDLSTQRSLLTDNEGSLRSITGHDWINTNLRSEEFDTSKVFHDEQVSDILGNQTKYKPFQIEDAKYDRPFLQKKDDIYFWEVKDTLEEREYEKVPQDVGYDINAAHGNEEICREYSSFKELDKEKYHMEIELLIEKKEKECLRKELGTMIRYVDVFREECRSLKSSVDNALEMCKIMKQERDDLVVQSNRSLEENSEVILDLIKYQDNIMKLETTNEKLVKEKEMLQECLLQTGAKLPPSIPKTEVASEYSTKPNPKIQTTFPRRHEKLNDFKDTEFTVNMKEIDFLKEELDNELVTTEDNEKMKDHWQKPADLVEHLKKDPAEKSMLESQGCVAEERHRGKYQRNTKGRQYKSSENQLSLRRTSNPDDEPRTVNTGNFTKIRHLEMTNKRDHLKVLEPRQSNSPSQSNTSKLVKSHKAPGLSSQNNTRIFRNVRRTPSSSASQRPKNTSKVACRFVTSSRTNAGLNVRLAPNLSGLSPIVSQLDRRRHDELLKWNLADGLPGGVSQDCFDDDADSTILITADPFGRRQQRTHPTNKRCNLRNNTSFSSSKRQNPRKMEGKHRLTHSAGVILRNSTNKACDYDSSGVPCLDKPLTINFEDFVFRHRVKSSEDVANLRDPSPAELWFS